MILKKISIVKWCSALLLAFLLLAYAFYFIAGQQMYIRDEDTAAVAPAMPAGEITAGTELRQSFTAQADELLWLRVLVSTYGRENTASLELRLLDAAGRELTAARISGAELVGGDAECTVYFPGAVSVERGARYTLEITSPDGESGDALTVWYGSADETGRSRVERVISPEDRLTVNGAPVNGMLRFSLRQRTHLKFGQLYWPLVWVLGAALMAAAALTIRAQNRGKSTAAFRLLDAFRRYGYLMRQLIARDFKTKYKRSVLGVLWSFLNPLLTMLVQYLVFSTLFKSDIPNFPVYLLSGIVCFSFFSEATGMSLLSIVGNASLITKVYVPKYIYPISRVLSSSINLLLSMIPLFLVMLLTGTPLRPSVLLLPFALICLVAFCIGVGFVLSTMMVFFRDTQFLWGVVSMLWMYLTPIFYPESIIPARLLPLFKCNPLYHVIRFVRIVLINGVSPEPKAYGYCLLASFVPLLVGAVIFKKNQDKFIVNL